MQVFCKKAPRLKQYFDKRTLNCYESYYFYTRVIPAFNFYGNLFYVFSELNHSLIKVVPTNIKAYLTPRALAF